MSLPASGAVDVGPVRRSISATTQMDRWASLVGAMWMDGFAGSSYAFSLYANDLKSSLNLTQTELQTVASVGDAGLYLTILAGVAFDALGPVFAAVVGALLSGAGYALLWSAARGYTQRHLGLLCFYSLLFNHGSSWLSTVAVSTSVSNFRSDRGIVLGLIKSVFGLSASIFTVVFLSIYVHNASHFLLFCAASIGIVGIATGVVTRIASSASASTSLRLWPLLGWGQSAADGGGGGGSASVMLGCCSHGRVASSGDVASLYRPLGTADKQRLVLGYVIVALLLFYVTGVAVLTAHNTIGPTPGVAYGILLFIVLSFGIVVHPKRWQRVADSVCCCLFSRRMPGSASKAAVHAGGGGSSWGRAPHAALTPSDGPHGGYGSSSSRGTRGLDGHPLLAASASAQLPAAVVTTGASSLGVPLLDDDDADALRDEDDRGVLSPSGAASGRLPPTTPQRGAAGASRTTTAAGSVLASACTALKHLAGEEGAMIALDPVLSPQVAMSSRGGPAAAGRATAAAAAAADGHSTRQPVLSSLSSSPVAGLEQPNSSPTAGYPRSSEAAAAGFVIAPAMTGVSGAATATDCGGRDAASGSFDDLIIADGEQSLTGADTVHRAAGQRRGGGGGGGTLVVEHADASVVLMSATARRPAAGYSAPGFADAPVQAEHMAAGSGAQPPRDAASNALTAASSSDIGAGNATPRKQRPGEPPAAHALPSAASEQPIGATFIEGVLSLDYWLIMLLLFIGTGSGIVMINNLAAQVQALGGADNAQVRLHPPYTPCLQVCVLLAIVTQCGHTLLRCCLFVAGLQDIYIILFSTFNCKGRMLGGYLSDAYSKRLNRAGWLTLALVSMAAAMVLTAFSDATGLLFAVSWAGGELHGVVVAHAQRFGLAPPVHSSPPATNPMHAVALQRLLGPCGPLAPRSSPTASASTALRPSTRSPAPPRHWRATSSPVSWQRDCTSSR